MQAGRAKPAHTRAARAPNALAGAGGERGLPRSHIAGAVSLRDGWLQVAAAVSVLWRQWRFITPKTQWAFITLWCYSNSVPIEGHPHSFLASSATHLLLWGSTKNPSRPNRSLQSLLKFAHLFQPFPGGQSSPLAPAEMEPGALANFGSPWVGRIQHGERGGKERNAAAGQEQQERRLKKREKLKSLSLSPTKKVTWGMFELLQAQVLESTGCDCAWLSCMAWANGVTGAEQTAVTWGSAHARDALFSWGKFLGHLGWDGF